MNKMIKTLASQIKEFKKDDRYEKLLLAGAHLSYICPLMYVDNPVAGAKPIITNSNKLRTYSKSRYYKDEEILNIKNFTQKKRNNRCKM